MGQKTILVIIPLILVGFIHVIPVDATHKVDILQDNPDEQTHLECMRSVPSYYELTFVEKKICPQSMSWKET